MKRWLTLALGLLLAAALLTALPGAVHADPLVPGRPEGALEYPGNVPLYDREEFGPWSYTFEGEKWDEPGFASLYVWMNQALAAKAWLLKVAWRILEFALLGDLITPLLPGAIAAMEALGAVVWENDGGVLVVGALMVAGVWALLLRLRGQAGRAWGAMGATALVLAGLALVLQGGPAMVEATVEASRALSVQVFTSIHGEDEEGRALYFQSGDGAWRVLVHDPWVAGELSEAGMEEYTEDAPGDGFLAMTPAERLEICNPGSDAAAEHCPWWGVDYLPRRLTLALWTLTAAAAYAGTVIALAGGMIAAQLQLLLVLALAPAWLLAALWWPEGGARLLRWLAGRVLTVLVSQVVLAATLGVLLSLTLLVSTAFSEAGWMLQSLLLAALAVLLFRYRYAWLEPINRWTRRREQAAARARETASTAAGAEAPSAAVRPREALPVGNPAPVAALYEAGAVALPPDLALRQPAEAPAPGQAAPVGGGRREVTEVVVRTPAEPRERFAYSMGMLRERLSRNGPPPGRVPGEAGMTRAEQQAQAAAAGLMQHTAAAPRERTEQPLPVQRPRS